MNLAEARMKLALAAQHKPALAKLLAGKVESKEDLEAVAQATSELGMFELSFLVRAVAQGGAELETNVAKLALFVSSVSDETIAGEVTKHFAKEAPELAKLFAALGKLER